MKTVLGIAAYGSPPSVLDLVAKATSTEAEGLFDLVLIVDSHGDGSVQKYIESAGLAPGVKYYDSEENLGAAGNLAKRLRWAAEAGGDLLFAINADGHFDSAAVEKLLDYARESDCGAVYPARRLADDCFEFTGTLRFPWRSVRRSENELPDEEPVRVFWSSSNGAVYSLKPTVEGILPPVGLWHGWEDLAYGLLLERAGYRQGLLTSVRVESRYEVRSVGGEARVTGPYGYVSDKPAWLAYYTSRNLLLIATRVVPRPVNVVAATARILIEILVTLMHRNRKSERLRYLIRGILDGLRGRQGMVVRPHRDRQTSDLTSN